MPKVIADITMSLDGYVTGPGADREHGLGDAPELHAWVAEQDPVEGMLSAQMIAANAAALDLYRRAWIPEQSFARYLAQSLRRPRERSRGFPRRSTATAAKANNRSP